MIKLMSKQHIKKVCNETDPNIKLLEKFGIQTNDEKFNEEFQKLLKLL